MPKKFTLKQWRNIRGLSQKELAEQVGLSTKTISNYESDVARLGNARYADVQKIVDVLDIKLSDIFLNTTSENPK